MYGAVVELDTLTDTDRSRTENNNLFLAGIFTLDKLFSFVFLVECRVEVGRFRLEFARAGVNHFEHRSRPFGTLLSAQTLDSAVQIAVPLCKVVFFLGKFAVLKKLFQLHKVVQLGQEPAVYLCDFVYSFNGNAPLQSLEHRKGTLVVHGVQQVLDLVVFKLFKLFQVHGIHSQFN